MLFFFYLINAFILLLAVGVLLNKAGKEKQLSFSIIVPFKNEESNLPALFSALTQIDYSVELFEILLIDDNSTDNSGALAKQFADKHSHIHFFSLEHETSELGKKAALTLGAEKAQNEFLVFTDADCQPPSTWLQNYTRFIDQKTGMVVGYKTQNEKKLFSRFILQASAAINSATIGLHWPFGATGSNIALRKSAFAEVGGFHKVKHHIAGDDMLMVKLINKTRWKIRYNYLDSVQTSPLTTQKKVYEQQKRKFSKLHMYSFDFLIVALIMLFYFVSLPIYIIQNNDFIILISYTIALLLFWIAFLYKHKERFYMIHIIYLLIYPYYVMIFSALGYVFGWKWK